MVATPALGLLADRIKHHELLLALGAMVLPLSIVLFGDRGVCLWIPTALLGLSFSLLPILWPSVARHVRQDQAGTAYGLMSVLQNAGLTVANVFAGYLNDHNGASATHPEGYEPMLWFFGLVSCSGCVFAVLLVRHTRAKDEGLRGCKIGPVPGQTRAID